MSTTERSADFIQNACNLAMERMKAGDSPEAVEQKLREFGLNDGEASLVTRETFKVRSTEVRSGAQWAMLGGIGLICAGVGVTVVSYQAAAANPDGGSYTIWWGPVVWGGAIFFGGLMRYLSGKE